MDFRRLFDILPYQQHRFPNKKALATRDSVGWHYYSTHDCEQTAARISAGWLALGLKRGDRVALLAERCSPRWLLLDIALMQAGLIPVPIHSQCSEQELHFILKDAAVRYVVAANREATEKALQLKERLPGLQGVYCMQPLPDHASWDDLLIEPTASDQEKLQVLRAAIHEEDLATIVYTSGTAGEPKGVMLSHRNIVSNIKATISLVPVNARNSALSFLPPSHIFERMVNYAYLACGASIYYSNNPEETRYLLRKVRPHYFTAVPRLLERAYDEIQERVGQLPLLPRWVARWATRVGVQYQMSHPGNLWYRLQLFVARRLVFGTWKRLLGGRVKGVLVGAAALQPKLARLFTAAGVPIHEGYGMTETSPVIAFNRFEPGGTRFGTVGRPIPGIEVKIEESDDGDGEILVRGPNVMLGYYNRPEDTQRALSEEGWLRTGDRGLWVHKRFLKITGRQKDIFKTTNGRYVAPEEIESLAKSTPYVEECMVLGAQRPFPVALILPQFGLLKQWCEAHNVHWTAPQFMVHNHKVMGFIQEQIATVNAQLPHYKQIGQIHLLHEPWTAASGDLTPTLKPRRERIAEKFQKEIDALYEQGAALRG
ncbi:MAG: long-chain fatty acid--CoA ligase [Phaeodactylibacter sp.]|uniref:AMP-dependent synthetase/ligase n=1 Tax=Phaeodactylibacter sp. TaxID=1940289 RepID=UPI0032EB9EBB